jgi:hypothetical protein
MLPRHEGIGSDAGDPDLQRQGSYADADRVLVITTTSLRR